MYNDARLPPTEAWQAMTRDLRKAKDERNALALENTCVLPATSTRFTEYK